jgi:TolA-binding protein
LILLGKIYRKGEMFDEAEKAFRMCIERYPQVLNSYSELGDLLLKQGKLREAADLFIGSIKRHRGGDSKTYFGLAKALALMGQLDEAARILEEAKTLYPSHSEISSAAQIQQ